MSTTSIVQAVKLQLIIATMMIAPMLQASDTLTVTFTGDVLLDRGVRRVIERNHNDPGCLFSASVDSVFKQSQVVVANLECPATKIKNPVFKNFIFRGEPEWLNTLKEHGITHLNLANNHSIDQGREGLLDTRINIVKAGMVPVGAAETMDKATQPVLLAHSPRKVYLVASLRLALENTSYLPNRPSVSQENFDSLICRIQKLKEHDPECCVIVSLHWGAEHMMQPAVQQITQAHQLIDAGADCLICHHTHTMQTVEQYKGKPIYYSIGNFIFDQSRKINSRACMVQLTITSNSLKAKTIPITIKNCVPLLD